MSQGQPAGFRHETRGDDITARSSIGFVSGVKHTALNTTVAECGEKPRLVGQGSAGSGQFLRWL